MIIRLIDLEIKLFIGDLPWEKNHPQTVAVNLELKIAPQTPPDYWAISQTLLRQFTKSRYEWLEDLGLAMRRLLKKKWNFKGRLTLSKYPKVRHSPKIFQVELPL